jgi:general secretion pathway protein K
MMTAHRQTGVALISVLLIVALVAVLVYHLIMQHSLAIARTQQSAGAAQSVQYALGAEAYARAILAANFERPDGRVADHLGEDWAQPLAPFEVEDGHLELDIEDLHGRFNLNALAASNPTAAVQAMRRLLDVLGLDGRIAELWKDWVDADDMVTGFGAEDAQYLLEEPPYRAANQPVASTSELRLLHEIDQEAVDVLLPHVVVLPNTEMRINVNTATAETLHAIAPAMSLERARSVVETPRAYEDLTAAIAEIPELGGAESTLSVTSAFFRIRAMAEIDGVRTELVSIVHRDPENGSIRLISRDFGRRHRSPASLESAR